MAEEDKKPEDVVLGNAANIVADRSEFFTIDQVRDRLDSSPALKG